MRGRIVVAAIACGACAAQPNAIEDPIEGVPRPQQQTVMRLTVDRDWPLTVGKGTLACRSGAVLFRAGGVNYALNDVARAHGFTSIEPIRRLQPSPPPSNPLKGRTQDQRMELFAELARCADGDMPAQMDCTRSVGARHRLTEADLRLITNEGTERAWPPLQRRKAPLEPLVNRGLRLCGT